MRKYFNPAQLIATFLYVGYFPVSPGTVASALALMIWILIPWGSVLFHLAIVGSGFIMGLVAATKLENSMRIIDPSCVVIDEVVGMWLALTPLVLTLQPNFNLVLLAFVIFRILDITKILAIKKLEKIKGGIGIMLDDLLAGFYTALIIYLLDRLWL